MNKTELVASVAEKAGLTKKDSEKAYFQNIAEERKELDIGRREYFLF